MQQFSKWNKGYRYLLMVLDLFSKYGWIVPLKDKKGETVTEAFKTIFKEGRKPQYLWTDKGKQYYNKNMKELLEKNNITLYSTENEEKSSVCERWNRTIKTKMWKQFTVQGNTQYLDILLYRDFVLLLLCYIVLSYVLRVHGCACAVSGN